MCIPLASLQKQGVPVPDKIPVHSHTVTDKTPLDGRMGGTRTRTTVYRPGPAQASRSRQRGRSKGKPLSSYNPASVGQDVAGKDNGGGVGALEAEFLAAIVILILLLFASSDQFSNRIMSFMKRGTLACVLFFILAIISSAGPNAAKFAKVFGALIIVAILVTSPMTKVFSDLDNIVKNDWVSTNESADQKAASSADEGTQQSTSSPGFLQGIENDVLKAIPGSPQNISEGVSLWETVKSVFHL